MAFKVSTKGGDTYKATHVEHLGAFVQMKFWDGEIRIPGGEVTKIETVGRSGTTEFQALLVVFLVSFIIGLIIFV